MYAFSIIQAIQTPIPFSMDAPISASTRRFYSNILGVVLQHCPITANYLIHSYTQNTNNLIYFFREDDIYKYIYFITQNQIISYLLI